MRILVKRGPKNWLLCWKPLKGQSWYPIHYNNVVFAGAIQEIRAKFNRLLRSESSRIEFEAYYCRATKTLALWS